MRELTPERSERLDALLASLPADVSEAIRQIYCAGHRAEVRIGANNLTLALSQALLKQQVNTRRTA